MEVLVPGERALEGEETDELHGIPSDELVEDVDVLLYLINLCRLFGIEYGKRRDGGAIVEVVASRLEKAADEDDFKEGVCIFEEFEGGAGLDEFGGVGIKVAVLDGLEVLVELVSEDWGR